MDSEGIVLQFKTCDGIFTALVVSCFTIVFVKIKRVISTWEDVNIQLDGILDSAPADFRRKRDNGTSFGVDGNIFESCFNIPPRSTRNLLARKEVEPGSSRVPDFSDGGSCPCV